ncbi:hypothetical protein [uncultured Gammaproteobacteria bacterium]|jgi:hypothetical protein|nr:hypothetical protein [uncultured Gammaproteobacteria bacterium]CAC9971086.1 hypothetical protein [uncultured Gammaproteobacteria bacterium]
MVEYKKIDESAWNNFGKNLLNNKGSDEQIEFLQACRNGKDDFLNYLNEKLLNNKEVIIKGETVFFDHKFTEAEFRFPPIDTQEIIWNVFGKITRENMGSCGFWGYIVVQMIKYDCIKSDYLASNLNGVNETGVYILDNAINSNDNKKIDDCTRRILRSMGNSAPRGKRIVFNDFYLGKAYWRWNWANKMSKEISLNFEEILAIFDETSYGVFSERMHSKDSYISQINTLGGLLLFLKENNLKGKLKNVIKTISYLSAWKAIEVQSPELNKEEIVLISNNL